MAGKGAGNMKGGGTATAAQGSNLLEHVDPAKLDKQAEKHLRAYKAAEAKRKAIKGSIFKKNPERDAARAEAQKHLKAYQDIRNRELEGELISRGIDYVKMVDGGYRVLSTNDYDLRSYIVRNYPGTLQKRKSGVDVGHFDVRMEYWDRASDKTRRDAISNDSAARRASDLTALWGRSDLRQANSRKSR